MPSRPKMADERRVRETRRQPRVGGRDRAKGHVTTMETINYTGDNQKRKDQGRVSTIARVGSNPKEKTGQREHVCTGWSRK